MVFQRTWEGWADPQDVRDWNRAPRWEESWRGVLLPTRTNPLGEETCIAKLRRDCETPGHVRDARRYEVTVTVREVGP